MGRKSTITGKTAENWVEASLRQYRAQGLAHGQRNFPEIRQQGFRAVVVGKAGPDWTVFSGGRAFQVEVKTWKGLDRHRYSFTGSAAKTRRRAQYLTLMDAVEVGGALGFYLVAWRHASLDGGVQWRLHEAARVPFDGNGLDFVREEGEFVPSPEGWPDWLEVATCST